MRDFCGNSGIDETPQACSAKKAQHPPAESEHPEAEINSFFDKNKVYENSLRKNKTMSYDQ
ncbi:hypothetical protein NG54_04580 [Heyndrickxia ginsengihumi]|uniref:Uncharacterized protein n=1 Tax=Heyndrickxia ginsengihumi TaxID=363870 RepID=A0A0A6VF09_9BACI|nr:hypothetical protein NG54_04580 [Heyndrickxia ginsengihumi]